MVQESRLNAICITEKLKPRSAIKGTLRGVRGGENSPLLDFLFCTKNGVNSRKQNTLKKKMKML